MPEENIFGGTDPLGAPVVRREVRVERLSRRNIGHTRIVTK